MELLNKIRCAIRAKWIAFMQWFDDSETKFLAWAQGAIGVVVVIAGSTDFTSLVGNGLTPKQMVTMGAGLLVKSALDYAARKYREHE